jgi:hypothetical protein
MAAQLNIQFSGTCNNLCSVILFKIFILIVQFFCYFMGIEQRNVGEGRPCLEHRNRPSKGGQSMLECTSHAKLRMAQRGISPAYLEFFWLLADHEVPLRGGLWSWTVSRHAAEKGLRDGHCVAKIEMVRKYAAVVSGSGEIVTVLRTLGSQGRRYRSNMRKARRLRRQSWQKPKQEVLLHG